MVLVSGLLFVCTGNLCRSPLAEALTRAAMHSRFGLGPDLIDIASAGTQGLDSQPMWPLAAAELARRGVHCPGFRSRALGRAAVLSRDLVLTATLRHRNELVSTYPAVRGRVFSWREFAWLLSDVGVTDVSGLTPAQRLRALPDMATKQRDSSPSRSIEAMDVADPMGGDAERFRTAAEQIAESVGALVSLL